MNSQKILNELKEACLKKMAVSGITSSSFPSGQDFEKFVVDIAKEKFDDVEHFHDGTFPDVRVEKTGIEIKMRQDGSWDTIGNSIRESKQGKNLEEIYIFFLSFADDKPVIKFAPYENCVSGIAITHSPRYTIDMDLDPSKSIFNIAKVKRTDDFKIKIKKFVEYYKQNKLKLSWLDLFLRPETATSAVLASIPKGDKRDALVGELFALCPEIYEEEYSKASMRLLTAHNTLIHNLRDFFSASGQVESPLKKGEKISRKAYRTYELAKYIFNFLASADEDLLALYWLDQYDKKMNPVDNWLHIIDDEEIAKLFNAGLKS